MIIFEKFLKLGTAHVRTVTTVRGGVLELYDQWYVGL